MRGRTSTRRFNQSEPLVRDRPKGFGDKPDAYNSDAVFLMGIGAEVASMLEHVPPERRPYVRAGTPEQVANDLKP